MSATVILQLTFSATEKPAGSAQTESVAVTVEDANGAPVGSNTIAAPGGVPVASEVQIVVPAGTGYIAKASTLDAAGQPTGPVVVSAPFDAADDVSVTVVASIAKV